MVSSNSALDVLPVMNWLRVSKYAGAFGPSCVSRLVFKVEVLARDMEEKSKGLVTRRPRRASDCISDFSLRDHILLLALAAYSQSNRRETVLQSRMNCVNQIYLSQLGVSNLIYNLKVACPSKCGASYFIYIVRQIYLTSCTCRCFEYRSICLQSVYRIHLLFKDTSRSAPSAPLSSLSTSDPLNVEALKLGARYSILDI